MKCLWVFVLAAACCLSSAAQSSTVAPGAQPGTAQILKWLGSKDPKMVAWGASYARDNRADAVADKLTELAEDWPGSDDSDLGREQHDAMLAVLDSVIQRDLSLSGDAVANLDSDFPTQAVVLASRLPVITNTALLLDWFENGMDSAQPTLEATAAGMMLVKEPPGGFAAEVVNGAEEQLTISLNPSNGTLFRNWGLPCTDVAGVKLRPDWPPLYTYAASRGGDDGALIAEAAGERLYYDRLAATGPSLDCSRRISAARLRHVLMAAMLGLRDRQMASAYWMPIKRELLTWQNAQQYTQQLQQLVSTEESRMNSSVQALHSKGVLTDEEAQSVRPKLRITVRDNRGPDADSLPDISFTDPRTTLTVTTGGD